MPFFKKTQPTPETVPSKPTPELPTNKRDFMVASLAYVAMAYWDYDSTLAAKASFPKEVAWDAEMNMCIETVRGMAPANAEESAIRHAGWVAAQGVLKTKGWELPPEEWSADSLFDPED